MVWLPEGDIAISASSEFLDFDTLMQRINAEALTGYLAIEEPEQAAFFFKEGVPLGRNLLLSFREKLKERPYMAFFHKLPESLFLICLEIADSTEILFDHFRFPYEIKYFLERAEKTGFRGLIVIKEDAYHILVFDNGKPVLGCMWGSGAFRANAKMVEEILHMSMEADIRLFKKSAPFIYFEPKEISEFSGLRDVYLSFLRLLSSLRGFFGPHSVLRSIYAPKIEDYESLLALKSEASNVYLARGYTKDPKKTMQMVNDFWEVFYRYPKKQEGSLFMFGREKMAPRLEFFEEATSIEESLSTSNLLERLGLSYETKQLGSLMEEMNTKKLKTFLEIYNLEASNGRSIKNLKKEIVIKTLSSKE